MSQYNTEQLAQRLFDSRLLEAAQLDQALNVAGGRGVAPEEFVRVLVQRELLTNWQLQRILEGHRRGFFYGNWKILYIVGSGTFARVYRATHRKTGDVKALKVLRSRYSDDELTRERFIREARTVMDLRHPNIVPIHEVETERGRVYMVMDFVEGQNLRDYVRAQGKLKLTVALSIARDVASGLDYAMKRGVSHRDVKLSNVLLSSNGQAKLVDFGLAAVNVSDDDDADATYGPRSVDYAGLERATGVKRNDLRSDLFFLGCVLYHMLSGAPPLFETRERIKRLSPKRFREIAPITNHVPKLPHRVVILVNRLMDLNAEQRIQTPGQALYEIDQVIAALRGGDQEVFDAKISQQQAEQYAEMIARQEEGRNWTIMLIESNPKIQDIFRDKLKELGYRVLIMSSLQRAMERFRNLDPAEPLPAHCILFGCTSAGRSGLEAFNAFAQDAYTARIPAILLLDEQQAGFREEADLTAPYRKTAFLPIKLREFRQQLKEVLASSRLKSDEPQPSSIVIQPDLL